MEYVKRAKPADSHDMDEVRRDVAAIIERVRRTGQRALIEYNTMFDGNTRTDLRISPREIARAYELTDPQLVEDIRFSVGRVQAFAERQKQTLLAVDGCEVSPGVIIGQRIIPVRSCCCYVPGGGYPLYSSALMLAATAKAAGVERVAMSAPAVNGTDAIHPSMLVAMDIAGADEIYAVSGAHAIAAFTFGTEEISPVDMIVGAGNRYVTEAKRQCYGRIGIDFLAGPSEVLIIADEGANRDYLVADLLSESEHDEFAIARLITPSAPLAEEIHGRLGDIIGRGAVSEKGRRAWERGGEIIVAADIAEACDLANRFAPEHLVLRLSAGEEAAVERLHNYGSLFLGDESAVVFSDYVSGANHILPTDGAARYTGGVWVGTFCKVCTTQRITREGANAIAAIAGRLADGEGLAAHSRAASIRLGRDDGK